MNDFSWLIYAAGISENLSAVFILGAIAAMAWALFDAMLNDLETNKFKVPRLAIPTAVSCALISSILPSSNTIYAIAASEMGEEVLQSATATKAMKALDAWLDRQIAPDAPAGAAN